jgi:hypothetical protein
MKASEIIRFALANHYVQSQTFELAASKSIFMCHAIDIATKLLFPEQDWQDDLNMAAEVHETFMPIIRAGGTGSAYGTSCLTVFLSSTNKKYAGYRRRWSDNCNACFKIRVQWWNDHIAMLESKGL